MSTDPEDVVDGIARQWRTVRPDVDVAPMEIIARVSRLSRFIDRRLAENFARHGIESWMYDVMATLRRNGAPYELAAGQLTNHTMVTTGAITNRIDQLERRGLVERVAASDRRKVIVRLTADGLRLVDEVAPTHLSVEAELLSPLDARERNDLTAALRALLVGLGDVPPSQSDTTDRDRTDRGS